MAEHGSSVRAPLIPDDSIVAHRDLARRISREYWAYELAFDSDDMEQEAMIAVWEALDRFALDKGIPVRHFVAVIIRRHLADLVHKSRAQRRFGHSRAGQQHARFDEEEDLIASLSSLEMGPQLRLETIEELDRLRKVLADRLSDSEREAILARIAGQSYGGNKAMDNALQRAKAKLAVGGTSCPDCGHMWERHDPKGHYASFVKAAGGCCVRRCHCVTVPPATAMAVAA